MKVAQVQLFRKALVGLILVVMAAVALNYVHTWRTRARIVTQAAKILSTDMLRSADAIEYSEQENGVMHFKLHAEKLLESRKGINQLEGIDAYDYGPDGKPKNHIRSRKAEYDREQRRAFFFGDVQIQASPDIELRTDSLHYDLGANSGNTDELVNITSHEAHGSAKGVRYDQTQGTLELLSNVDFVVKHKAPGQGPERKSEDMRVLSDHGFYSESTRTFRLSGHTRIESAGTSLSGDQVEAAFSPDKKRLTSLNCTGNAVYTSRDSDENRTLRGEQMVFVIDPSLRTIKRIDIFRSAGLSMTSPASDQLLTGAELHMVLDPEKGFPTGLESAGAVSFKSRRDRDQSSVEGEKLAATFKTGSNMLDTMRVWGGAKMSSRSGSDSASDSLEAGEIRLRFGGLNGRSVLSGLEAENSVRWISTPPRPAQGKQPQAARSLSGSLLKMNYSDSGEFLESGQASGGVTLTGIPLRESGQIEIRRMQADAVRFGFYARSNKLRSVDADDHVTIFYRSAPSEKEQKPAQEFNTSSTKMRARFSEIDGSAESVQQIGNFNYRDGSRTATSDTGDYDAGKQVLLLKGSPRIVDETAITTGEILHYDRANKVLRVNGRVRSALRPKDSDQTPFSSSSGSASPSVVMSEKMEYWTDTSEARYSGKVQMLSESSQLSARSLNFKDAGSQVVAEGDVRHLLSRAQGQDKKKTAGQKPESKSAPDSKSKSSDSPVLVQCMRLQYSKDRNSIHYEGEVTLQSDDMWMASDSLDALIRPDGKEIERAAARGQLYLKQAGREVHGQDGDYDLQSGKIVVTGSPAEVRDPLKGKSSARRLTFFTADDRILLGP